MDLSTTYLGLTLKNPLVASASPLSENLDNFKRLEDRGIAAIVKHSLFEEQLSKEAMNVDHHLSAGTDSYAEALSFFPGVDEYKISPEGYLKAITDAKKAVGIPVIGSLNGHSLGGWTDYAGKIEQAGADALELNIYAIPTDLDMSGVDIEQKYVEIVQAVKGKIKIPVAVKLSPYFSNMANMAKQLVDAGADGLVLFNRFYQPDIDLENLDVLPNVQLSTDQAQRLPMRWIAILYGRLQVSLAATSGIHHANDVLKMLMVGADTTMLCSTFFKNGIKYVEQILTDMQEWMKAHEYESVKQMQGSMSQKNCASPEAFERANYMKALQSLTYVG